MVETSQTVESNPLLTWSKFPLFDKVTPEHVVPGMKQLLADLHQQLDELEKNVKPTWAGLVEPLERIVDVHQRTWGVVSHLKMVKDNPEIRKAVEEMQPENVKLSLRISQSKPLYQAYKELKDSEAFEKLTTAQKRVIENELRDFVLGGIALEGAERERFNEIQQELTKLSTTFTNNVLDGTKAYKKLVTDKSEVEGLPANALGLTSQAAAREGNEGATAENGPWLITLDFPCYYAVLTHCKNRALREEVYRANIGKAAEGSIDNTPVINRILELRQEKAKLLGFPTFADLSLYTKMATLEKAEELLEEMRQKSYDAAKADMAEVQKFANENGQEGELKWWDVSFWAERMREAKYNISDEELRPYFALPNVLKGLFELATRLFGVTVEEADGMAPVWHKDVRFFKLLQDGKPKSYFYLDPYSRPEEKKSGAWFNEVVGQSALLAEEGEGVRLPVGHMVCNQTPPVGDEPSLMTFREVETLFHEFGHCLQHMLTQVNEGMVSGIRGVEWDAVELPSQFMENWCYDRKTLYSFAKHHSTGEPLPEDMYQRLIAAKNYRKGSFVLRQLHFGKVDLELHARYKPGGSETIFDCDRRVAETTQIMPPFEGDRFLCSFSHIFAGGYSAGYYSYMWAEVLSADAFAAFEEAGLEDEEGVVNTGRKFRDTVLALGGSLPAADVFQLFRGRDPTPDAILRHNGLVGAAA